MVGYNVLEQQINFLEKKINDLETKTEEQERKIIQNNNNNIMLRKDIHFLSVTLDKLNSNINKLTFLIISSIILSIVKYFFKF